MNRLKIGNQIFNLNNYFSSIHKNRPSWVFDIDSPVTTIKPLIIDNQTFIVSSEVDGEISERDLSSDCILFGSLLEENNNTCVLTMENYSKEEIDKQTIEDLQVFIEELIGG